MLDLVQVGRKANHVLKFSDIGDKANIFISLHLTAASLSQNLVPSQLRGKNVINSHPIPIISMNKAVVKIPAINMVQQTL